MESAIAAASYLGYSQLTSSQLTSSQSLVLHRYLSGKDMFVNLPYQEATENLSATGCSQELLMLYKRCRQGSSSLWLLFPLIVLTKDQVAKLEAIGVEAVCRRKM